MTKTILYTGAGLVIGAGAGYLVTRKMQGKKLMGPILGGVLLGALGFYIGHKMDNQKIEIQYQGVPLVTVAGNPHPEVGQANSGELSNNHPSVHV